VLEGSGARRGKETEKGRGGLEIVDVVMEVATRFG
jgi:hypothetical protein